MFSLAFRSRHPPHQMAARCSRRSSWHSSNNNNTRRGPGANLCRKHQLPPPPPPPSGCRGRRRQSQRLRKRWAGSGIFVQARGAPSRSRILRRPPPSVSTSQSVSKAGCAECMDSLAAHGGWARGSQPPQFLARQQQQYASRPGSEPLQESSASADAAAFGPPPPPIPTVTKAMGRKRYLCSSQSTPSRSRMDNSVVARRAHTFWSKALNLMLMPFAQRSLPLRCASCAPNLPAKSSRMPRSPPRHSAASPSGPRIAGSASPQEPAELAVPNKQPKSSAEEGCTRHSRRRLAQPLSSRCLGPQPLPLLLSAALPQLRQAQADGGCLFVGPRGQASGRISSRCAALRRPQLCPALCPLLACL
jgi:hypothetical protein